MEDHAPKLKGLLWLIAACIIGMLVATGISPLAHAIPWSWEKVLASKIGADLPKAECRGDPQAQALLEKLVKRIYPILPEDTSFSIHVQIVKDPAVNAYAQLGGYILINSGLLEQAQSPEEIAGILAHEIGHVHNRHIMESALVHMFTVEGINMIFHKDTSTAYWTHYFLNLDFSRSQESQADLDGLGRLQKAHVDNQGFKRFFERMEKNESVTPFISDHPSNQSRLEMAGKFDNHATTPIMTRPEWIQLKNYCNEQ